MANSLRNRTIKIDDGCHTAVMGSMEKIGTVPFVFLFSFSLWGVIYSFLHDTGFLLKKNILKVNK